MYKSKSDSKPIFYFLKLLQYDVIIKVYTNDVCKCVIIYTNITRVGAQVDELIIK
jgi:hypothetical protein